MRSDREDTITDLERLKGIHSHSILERKEHLGQRATSPPRRCIKILINQMNGGQGSV